MKRCVTDGARLESVRGWRAEGVTWAEIERRTGVKAAAWRRKLNGGDVGNAPPRLSHAKLVARVEEALLSLCVGRGVVEEKTVEEVDPKGESKRVERVRKAVEPDLKAIQWWLERRAPERWGEAGQSGGVTVVSHVPRPGSEGSQGDDEGGGRDAD